MTMVWILKLRTPLKCVYFQPGNLDFFSLRFQPRAVCDSQAVTLH